MPELLLAVANFVQARRQAVVLILALSIFVAATYTPEQCQSNKRAGNSVVSLWQAGGSMKWVWRQMPSC